MSIQGINSIIERNVKTINLLLMVLAGIASLCFVALTNIFIVRNKDEQMILNAWFQFFADIKQYAPVLSKLMIGSFGLLIILAIFISVLEYLKKKENIKNV